MLEGCLLNLCIQYGVCRELSCICCGGLMVFPTESAPCLLESCREQHSEKNVHHQLQCKATSASMSLTEHTSGNLVRNFKPSQHGFVCVCVSVSVCVLLAHSAGSADLSLHRLLVCTTALLSSLISSVNVSL